MKFNKSITFEAATLAALDRLQSNQNQCNQSRQQPKRHWKSKELQDESIFGQVGTFTRVPNDFTISTEFDKEQTKRFQDESSWSSEKRESVKKVRFCICILALIGLAFALMSRLILNVCIVEMVKSKPIIVPGEEPPIESTTATVNITTISSNQLFDGEEDLLNISMSQIPDVNPQAMSPLTNDDTTATVVITKPQQGEAGYEDDNNSINNHNIDQDDDGLRFDWTKKEVNIILASFYAGYAPSIMFGGGLAERYGSKYPFLVCVFGTSIINVLTPTIAKYSLVMLVLSRVLLGLIQGSLLPCLYDLFNKWLTANESSIFAPMIKVSIPLGSLIGTLMPGLLASLGFEWPLLFYLGGLMCILWSIVWFALATSTPQTNKFIEPNELKRIMRKKQQTVEKRAPYSSTEKLDAKLQQQTNEKPTTPWLLIITNPSVIALTLVKLTYNFGVDFIFLELAVYLRDVHDASIETISIIAGSGYCMQMFLITFVGWVAKTVINRRTMGLSITKWRKVFQGGSNFAMAAMYFLLPMVSSDLALVSIFFLLICFFWMLGAGGESMVPYDLSSKYPASIMGMAHSISVLSGLTVPALCNIVLGEDNHDPSRWNLLFIMVASALTFGGLVFIFVLKSKPFLPEEKAVTNGNCQVATINSSS